MITSLVLGASLLGAATGCTKSDDDSGGAASSSSVGASGGGDGSALVAAGKAVYAGNGCARCHAIGGQGDAWDRT